MQIMAKHNLKKNKQGKNNYSSVLILFNVLDISWLFNLIWKKKMESTLNTWGGKITDFQSENVILKLKSQDYHLTEQEKTRTQDFA